MFLKQTKSVINIIPYFIGISKINKGSFVSIQTFFNVVSKRLGKILTAFSGHNWKCNKYRHMIRGINGKIPEVIDSILLLHIWSKHAVRV